MTEIETVCRDILHRASLQERIVNQAAPEAPSPEYLTGFGAGQLDGQLGTAAMILGLVLDDSPTRLLDDARSQAAVESAFPFDLHIDPA